MENKPSRLLLERKCQTNMFTTIRNTNVTQSSVYERGRAFFSTGSSWKSKWLWMGSSIFPKPKTNWIRFMINFRNSNKKLRRRPRPMPKTNEMLSKSKSFNCYTSTNLNMQYYYIWLSEDTSILRVAIISWIKYHYKNLTMGVSNSPDISQHETNDLFRVFEFICAYIDNLLILTKGDCKYHL